MENKRKYWKSVGELEKPEFYQEAAKNEFPEEVPVDAFLSGEKLQGSKTNRRDFLKFLGFSVSAATLAACETPVIHSIPYVVKPEEITPGVANWYATTYYDGMDYASILVKTREGRPIHIQGNPLSKVTAGRVNARINSSVLSLYDDARLKTPYWKGEASDWDTVDTEISTQLAGSGSGRIVILSNTIISPSTKEVIKTFASKYPNTSHISYDAVSYSGIRKAYGGIIPDFDFSKAKTIVSIGADFLGEWINSVQHSGNYAMRRRPDGEWMSRHWQFESILSMTGSNADVRVKIKPSEYGKVAAALLGAIGGGNAGNGAWGPQVTKAAKDLQAAGSGNALVVCGSNDPAVQAIVKSINERLGSNGSTVITSNPVMFGQGNDEEVVRLVSDMKSGNVSAIIIYGCNPVYSLPNGDEFAEALQKVKLSVSFSERVDETSSITQFICPDHHYLESWNDFQPKSNSYSIAQPTISPLYATRAAQDSLLTWAGSDKNYYDTLREGWNKSQFGMQSSDMLFDSFWSSSVHNGVFDSGSSVSSAASIAPVPVTTSADTAASNNTPVQTPAATASITNVDDAVSQVNSAKGGNWELVLYTKAGIGNGNQANNPWLQELPDPVTKMTWDNYITMSPAQMKELGFSRLERGDYEANLATVTVNGKSIVLPVIPQPGQTSGTIGIALGYGRTLVGKAGNEVGKNAYPLVGFANGSFQYTQYNVEVSPAEGKHEMASTQTHHTMMGRDIVKETILPEYKADPASGNTRILLATSEGLKTPDKVNLWKEHPVESIGHRWGMAIDLNACIGCGTCVTACTSENNVSVVGKEEVRRAREMHWLRIDRYYTSDADPVVNGGETEYTDMEFPSENPQVVFQPMMCQHCNHAPCETVCPVAATTHSNEGLNQMAYNRCIGTRYCANNCPYKVRRFNWFNYTGNEMFADVNPAQGDIARMVLNPDVVVRSRGVIEKCSMCVQRIQAGKLEAKKASSMVLDGMIQTACAAACPTNAIIFGDLNDNVSNDGHGSQVKQMAEHPRAYNLLEEVGTKPNIYYLTKVRNLGESEKRTTPVETGEEA